MSKGKWESVSKRIDTAFNIGRREGAKNELERLKKINDLGWLENEELMSGLESRTCYAQYSSYLNKIIEKRLNTLTSARELG